MLKRFYADNFRCLTNFELELDEANVFLGANGTGKTSVLEVLRKIQDLIARGRRVGEAFPVRDVSLGQDRNTQRIPRRNIETWLWQLQSHQTVDETYDYKPRFRGLEIASLRGLADELIRMCHCEQRLVETAPSSLQQACLEYPK